MRDTHLHDAVPGPAHGHFRLWVYRNGVLIDRDDHPNIIVNNAKTTQARLIGGDVTNRSITKIGFGEGTGAADAANTSLTNAFVRSLGTVSYPAANSVQFAFSLGTTEANGLAITEFGLFTNGDVLFARRVRAGALLKASDLSLTGTWTISY